MNDTVTSDLSEFGHRELEIVEKLLRAYRIEKPDYLYDGVKPFFNKMSAYVFLSDEDFNTAMLNDEDKLEQHMSCPNCGKEGLRHQDNEDLQWNDEEGQCGECSPEEEEDEDEEE